MLFFWALVSILLVLFAACSLLSLQPKTMIGIAAYWAASFIGQSFAPQLGVFSLLLIVLSVVFNAPVFTTITGAVALLLYLTNYRRGRRTQSAVDAVISKAVARLSATVKVTPTSSSLLKNHLLPVGFRPLKFRHKNVTCIKNIAYGEHGNANLLDIYHPTAQPDTALPILLFIPGGGWVTGSKNEQGLPLINHMAAAGWLCVAVNYRLGPESRFPAMLEDIFQAIRWVKTHAHSYGGDPNFIALAGNSAGGHLCSITALATPAVLAGFDFDSSDININIAASIYGRYDFLNRHQILPGKGLEPFLVDKVMPCAPTDCPQLWDLASPESLVHKDAPPFLMIHGTADAMIPVQEARAFYTALNQVSDQTVDYLEIPGAQHAFDMVCSAWAMPTVHGIADYLNAQHQNHLQTIQTIQQTAAPTEIVSSR